MPGRTAGAECLCSHFSYFLKEKLQVREKVTRVARGPVPQLVSPEVGIRGPLHLGVMNPWGGPRSFGAARVVRVTQWGLLHLGGELVRGRPGFLVLGSPGRKGWRAGPAGVGGICLPHSEGFRGFSGLEGIAELLHFKGVKVSLLSGWGMGLPYMNSNAFNFNLLLGTNCT